MKSEKSKCTSLSPCQLCAARHVPQPGLRRQATARRPPAAASGASDRLAFLTYTGTPSGKKPHRRGAGCLPDFGPCATTTQYVHGKYDEQRNMLEDGIEAGWINK